MIRLPPGNAYYKSVNHAKHTFLPLKTYIKSELTPNIGVKFVLYKELPRSDPGDVLPRSDPGDVFNM